MPNRQKKKTQTTSHTTKTLEKTPKHFEGILCNKPSMQKWEHQLRFFFLEDDIQYTTMA